MSEHTPGPWEVRDDPAGLRVTTESDVDGATEICEFPYDWPADQANARLIAAAPGMADLLRRFTEVSIWHEGSLAGLQAEAYALLGKIDGVNP